MRKFIGGFLAMLIFFELLGCQKTPNVTDDDVVCLRISCTHMAFSYSYNFKIGIKDDVVLFSCDCSIDKENHNDTRVSCENVEIDNQYFRQLLEILKKNNVTETVRKHKKKINLFFVPDKTEYSISLNFKNDVQLSADLHFEEVYTFLKQLASLYATEVTNE